MGTVETLQFGLLGPLEVRRGEESLRVASGKQRALLAVLLLEANRVVSSDRLIDDLWGEQVPPTANAALHVHVSQLRRVLEPDVRRDGSYQLLVTEGHGYAIRLAPERLDIGRFERVVEQGASAFAEGRFDLASSTLREALALWRGPALADFAYEPFAQAPAGRLEELRLGALERRIEADLARGRHAEVVPELTVLTAEHPLREALAGLLMLALYRCERQADALDVYQRTRRTLVDDLGIEPSPALAQLERDILVQDPGLTAAAGAIAPRQRAILVVSETRDGRADLVALAERLAGGRRPHELVVAQLLHPAEADELSDVAASLGRERVGLEERGVEARVAAFTSSDRAADISRLAARSEVDLLLVLAPPNVLRNGVIEEQLATLLDGVPCDVAFLVPRASQGGGLDGPVIAPFGGGQHDWAAAELAAWIAVATGWPFHLLGVQGGTEPEERDASRLLADASLLIQRASGVAPVPRLVGPGRQGTIEAAAAGGLLVVGLSERWREEGLGVTRWAIARSAAAPVLFVRDGPRPSGLAPDTSATKFAWSVTAAGS